MDLLRLSVTKDALIRKDALLAQCARPEVSAQWAADSIEKALPVRNATDNVRVALASKARAWQRFDNHGQECKAVVDSTKGAKGLDLRVHVRCKDTASVEYSGLVLSLTGGAGEPISAISTELGRRQYPDLVADLGNIPGLEAYGQQHFFDNDLRRLSQDLLGKATMALWPGVTLVLDSSARASVEALRVLLEPVCSGTVTCRLLSLDNTPANRQLLAEELAEKFQEELTALAELLTIPDPNLKRTRKLYLALEARVQQAEAALELEVPCWDELAALDMALGTLEDEAS